MTTDKLLLVRNSEAGPESRAARKERTRKALIDGTLELLADRSFASISLREVARTADIVPTAFYRHFASLEELGVVLVEESMRVLRQMLREVRRTTTPQSAKESLDVLVRHVSAHEAQFRFFSRERYGGVPEIRRAIAAEMRVFSTELTIDLSRVPMLAQWNSDDLEMTADLIVSTMLSAVIGLLEADAPGARSRDEVITQAERQLRLILLGIGQWRQHPS
ncbi:MAG: TetR family transcriptional regulator [Rhodococcus sp.]|nr:TetR family transcriptional regulator [Rhodococcus sp. (in: high G+C Gram-positive bacteria)]